MHPVSLRPEPLRAARTRSLPPWIVAGLLAALAAGGCVSKSDYEALEAELAACRQETAEAEADAATWQQRFDRESARWEQIGTSVEDALPRALSELEDERRDLLEAVPEQVQTEVVAYLDEYRNAMMAGVQSLQADNEEIRIQLLASQKALEAIGADTRAIDRAITNSLSDERSKREQVTTDLTDVVDLIVEFDQTRLNCDRCPDRLRMRDRSREALLGFHAELIQDLNKVATFSRGSLPAVALEDAAAAAEDDSAAAEEDAGADVSGDEAADGESSADA